MKFSSLSPDTRTFLRNEQSGFDSVRIQIVIQINVSLFFGVYQEICNWLRHTLLPRAFYCLGTLCIVTFCSKEQFASNWLVTVCFLTHFASQELNTLGSPTHFAKSQFTPQHTLLLNTLCHSEPFTPHYTLLINTLCHSEPSTPHYTLLLNTLCLPAPFASWSTLLLNTFCSMDRNGNNPIYPLLSTWISTWREP